MYDSYSPANTAGIATQLKLDSSLVPIPPAIIVTASHRIHVWVEFSEEFRNKHTVYYIIIFHNGRHRINPISNITCLLYRDRCIGFRV